MRQNAASNMQSFYIVAGTTYIKMQLFRKMSRHKIKKIVDKKVKQFFKPLNYMFL